MKTRVIPSITGIGTISAAGGNLTETLAAFYSGIRRIDSLTLFPSALRNPVFQAQLPSAAHTDHSRTLQLTLHAVREALAMAGTDLSGIPKPRIGVCLGTTVDSQLNDIDFYSAFRKNENPDLTPVRRYLKQNLAATVAASIGATGPCSTIVNACASGTDAVGVGASWIRCGLCDLVIAGGADELNLIPYAGFASLGVVSPSPCAPFDRDRQGLNLGEGAGILILENPRLRDGKTDSVPAISVVGYGNAADAHHMTAPHPQGAGLERAIHAALADAGVTPNAIVFVNAHGTATRDNDKVEGNTLARIFGVGLQFLSTKGFTGHTLGAAGGLEAAFTTAALLQRWLPATPGFQNQDPEIPICPISCRTAVDGDYAMSTSLAFGGSNAALIFKIQS